mmetsp:Transcript_87632/g.253076  ORF Transcript_87632/g.253076 Transcript_87632/m.253076 type:complete len:255 (+) Transcript_87632:298-1062(+)
MEGACGTAGVRSRSRRRSRPSMGRERRARGAGKSLGDGVGAWPSGAAFGRTGAAGHDPAAAAATPSLVFRLRRPPQGTKLGAAYSGEGSRHEVGARGLPRLGRRAQLACLCADICQRPASSPRGNRGGRPRSGSCFLHALRQRRRLAPVAGAADAARPSVPRPHLGLGGAHVAPRRLATGGRAPPRWPVGRWGSDVSAGFARAGQGCGARFAGGAADSAQAAERFWRLRHRWQRRFRQRFPVRSSRGASRAGAR